MVGKGMLVVREWFLQAFLVSGEAIERWVLHVEGKRQEKAKYHIKTRKYC